MKILQSRITSKASLYFEDQPCELKPSGLLEAVMQGLKITPEQLFSGNTPDRDRLNTLCETLNTRIAGITPKYASRAPAPPQTTWTQIGPGHVIIDFLPSPARS